MKNNGKKLVALLLVLMLVIGGAVGGTLAWLIAETDPVVNTFTVGNIKITLAEDGANDVNGTLTQSFKMVPGTEHVKAPKVTVEGGSEACWLFVKVEESCSVDGQTFSEFVQYGINEDVWGATPVESGTGWAVYGVEVASNTADQIFYVLGDCVTPATADQYDNGCVKIPSNVTKAMMDKVTDANAPKLTFTAYAIQSENLNAANAAAAWAQIKSDLSLS